MTSSDNMDDNLTPIDDAIVSQAVQWHLRVEGGDMTAPVWQEFSAWLAADPLHARAYDQIVEADDDLVALENSEAVAALPVAANDEPTSPSRRGFLIGGSAIAAAVVAGILLWPSQNELRFERYATGPLEKRTVDIGNGVRIEMNGATKIDVARGEQAVVRLARGEVAVFIEKRAPAAVRVEAGQISLVDNGTIFNVIRHDGLIRVAVSEGEVIANPERQAIALTAGQSLQMREGSGIIERGVVDIEAVAAWRRGQLAYSDTPAQVIATDIGRNLAIPVNLDPSMADRRLTGVVQLDGDEAEVVARAASLLGGRAQQTANGWAITAN